MPNFYTKYYPKLRTGKECTKTNCDRYKDYTEWKVGQNDSLKFCMECKHAHVSQYKPKQELS